MIKADYLRVAALVDLSRSSQSGGHVKCWEHLAAAAARANLPLDLTVYFSGNGPDEQLSPNTRLRYLPPIFSTASLKFLPYVPDHTDLASYNPRLARELQQYDVIHSTDGYFCFARTAARISRMNDIPLVTSIHTDTPSYARIFTHHTITKMLGTKGLRGWLARKMIDDWKLPERQENAMLKRLRKHLEQCSYALATRREDKDIAVSVMNPGDITRMRRGIDKVTFGPHRKDRAGVERDYNIPSGRTLILFVGRVDIGKNIYTLIEAMEKLLAEKHPVHLVVAGVGPASEDVRKRLGDNASLLGFVQPSELARLYASVDALAISSEVETYSMVGAEAITCGCPVLIARKSGIADLFNNTMAMRAVDSGVNAWADALRDFVTGHDGRAIMREAALKYSRTHLTGWQEVLTEDFFTVWQKAAGQLLEQKAA